MFLLIWPTGSPKLLQLAHRMRSGVPTRSTLSPGRSNPSTSNAAAPGTRPKAARFQSHLAVEDETGGDSRKIARSRYALWKNPDDLNGRQRQQLDWIAKTDPKLWRAYLLKEGLRYVFAVKGAEGKEALDKWLTWARRSQLPAFIQLSKKDHQTPSSDRRQPRPRSLPRPDRINTPRSGCSPESRSGSTAPNPSSPSHYSPSAATHHDSRPKLTHRSEPPRVWWRLKSLRRMGSCQDMEDIRGSCVSVRRGWCSIMRTITGRSGRRSVRSPRSWPDA